MLYVTYIFKFCRHHKFYKHAKVLTENKHANYPHFYQKFYTYREKNKTQKKIFRNTQKQQLITLKCKMYSSQGCLIGGGDF